jgi:ribosome-binding factor A
MQYRSHKLAEQFRVEISSILAREIRDQIQGLVSITEVQITPDHRQARVLISLFGSAEQKDKTLTLLTDPNGPVRQIRRLLGSRIRLRYTPELIFILDRSIEQGDRMVEMIEEINRELPEVDS